MIELLLPRTDTAVAVQLVVTAVVAPLVLLRLVHRRRTDVAWLLAGVVTLWVGFMGLRTLH